MAIRVLVYNQALKHAIFYKEGLAILIYESSILIHFENQKIG